jgi:predicted amidohydrolase YtcJ
LVSAVLLITPARAELVVHSGKIVTVDGKFRIAEALAIRGDRIVAVGSNAEVMAMAGPDAERVDLQGKTVLPGLIDSHAHPIIAALYDFDHPIPDMETIGDVLDYFRARAAASKPGEWICLEQVFVTRLRERRFPTRQELDEAAPNNPAVFRTGPDLAVNSLALKLSGIDKDFQITDGRPGSIERDPASGEPTGMLRNCQRLVKYVSTQKVPSDDDRRRRLREVLAAYNEAGITSVTDRLAKEDEISLYQAAQQRGELTCRVFVTYFVDGQLPWNEVEAGILTAAKHPLRRYDTMLWLGGVKVYLDGGMLTGSAYMKEPWGISRIYSITDPQYRGIQFIDSEKLYRIARSVLSNGMQLTAHCVGDGAVENLVNAYERVNRDFSVRTLRPCLSHANFMTPAAIEKMAEIGVVADLQPVWIYLDGSTLRDHFGDRRLACFQPYKTLRERGVVVGGGSDHMQKLGRRRSINPYDPFLGMWTTLVRQPRWTDEPLHPEERIGREDAIRLYTIDNAWVTLQEKEKGSLEPGKLADFIVLDRDILTCPVDEVKDIRVEATYLGGKIVFARR